MVVIYKRRHCFFPYSEQQTRSIRIDGQYLIFMFFFGFWFLRKCSFKLNKQFLFISSVFIAKLLLTFSGMFESAMLLHDRAFFNNIGSVLLFAVLVRYERKKVTKKLNVTCILKLTKGTVANTALVAMILYAFKFSGAFYPRDFSLHEILLFSALVAAVDPVAVKTLTLVWKKRFLIFVFCSRYWQFSKRCMSTKTFTFSCLENRC